jgi:hypothetical protein
MALSVRDREDIHAEYGPSAFLLPPHGYPIHDERHADLAVTFMALNGVNKPSWIAKIRKRYPRNWFPRLNERLDVLAATSAYRASTGVMAPTFPEIRAWRAQGQQKARSNGSVRISGVVDKEFWYLSVQPIAEPRPGQDVDAMPHRYHVTVVGRDWMRRGAAGDFFMAVEMAARLLRKELV